MGKILYIPAEEDGQGGVKDDKFQVGLNNPQVELPLLESLTRALPNTTVSERHIDTNSITLPNTPESILALWATGFEWDFDALKAALESYAKQIKKGLAAKKTE